MIAQLNPSDVLMKLRLEV